MADTLQFDLVSPERSLASFAAATVQIPGADGDMTAGPGHAQVITTLRPGILRVTGGPEGDVAFAVTGGFAEISGESTSVLAEKAVAVGDITTDVLDGFIADATAAVEKAPAELVDTAKKALADFEAMRAELA